MLDDRLGRSQTDAGLLPGHHLRGRARGREDNIIVPPAGLIPDDVGNFTRQPRGLGRTERHHVRDDGLAAAAGEKVREVPAQERREGFLSRLDGDIISVTPISLRILLQHLCFIDERLHGSSSFTAAATEMKTNSASFPSSPIARTSRDGGVLSWRTEANVRFDAMRSMICSSFE